MVRFSALHAEIIAIYSLVPSANTQLRHDDGGIYSNETGRAVLRCSAASRREVDGVQTEATTASPTAVPDARAEVDSVINTALTLFAADGFAATKLDTVAQASGVSKRAIRQHFSGKKGLYLAALMRAAERLSPPQEVLERSYAVPVEGMRRFVDSVFHRFLEHPEAVKLLHRENLDPVLDIEEPSEGKRNNAVVLHVERLLMLGQDAGAFRPGICAEDVLVLVISLCEVQVAHARTLYSVTSIDFADRRNIDGMRRLVIDAALSFLTSNIAPSGYDSYLASHHQAVQPTQPSAQVYGVGGGIY